MLHSPLSCFGVKNEKLEALRQLLALLDINPDEIKDEIKDEIYATALRILFSIIEKQIEEIELSRQITKNFETKSTYSNVNKLNLIIRGSKKKILEACAIAAHHQSTDIPVVTTLLSDDARQFK